jgi:hypothetical protein
MHCLLTYLFMFAKIQGRDPETIDGWNGVVDRDPDALAKSTLVLPQIKPTNFGWPAG